MLNRGCRYMVKQWTNGINWRSGEWTTICTRLMFVIWCKYRDFCKTLLLLVTILIRLLAIFFSVILMGFCLCYSDIYKSNKILTNFQQFLNNVFQPLFEVTNDPSSHPELHKFLQFVSWFRWNTIKNVKLFVRFHFSAFRRS